MNSKELLDQFNLRHTIREGALLIYGDSIGKPGDRIVELSSVYVDGEELMFQFKSEEWVKVILPDQIEINDTEILIRQSKCIKWKTPDLEIEYFQNAEEVTCNVIKGVHFFKGTQTPLAFQFYTW